MPSLTVLRDRLAPDHAKVGFIELFFDLVFVFAITQLSHGLLEHLTIEGALQTAFLMLATWAVWMWTTWAANWLHAGAVSVRLMLLGLMAAGLVMSTSIPEAFGARGLAFAVSYAAMQNGRNLFVVWALRRGDRQLRVNFWRIQVWLALGGAAWIAGGVAEGAARWAFWSLGLFLELGSPWWAFWVPGMGRSLTSDWSVDPAHMAERCGLFVILALGESIIILGATFAGLEWSLISAAAFAIGFIGSVAMWWVYFATTAEAADESFVRHVDPGRVARAAYTYAHIPLVAGIILAAVADELVLAHPAGHADAATLACVLGGPALFLAGDALFNRMVRGVVPASHPVGILALAAAGMFIPHAAPLLLAAIASGTLVLVGLWETMGERALERRTRGESSAPTGGQAR